MTNKTNLTRQGLIDSIAGAAGLSKADATRAHDALFATIKTGLSEGKTVRIGDFGSFEVSHRKERLGRNPSTGEVMTIAASNGVKFKQAKALKDSVN